MQRHDSTCLEVRVLLDWKTCVFLEGTLAAAVVAEACKRTCSDVLRVRPETFISVSS